MKCSHYGKEIVYPCDEYCHEGKLIQMKLQQLKRTLTNKGEQKERKI